MGWDSLSPGIRGLSSTPGASPFFSFLGWMPFWSPFLGTRGGKAAGWARDRQSPIPLASPGLSMFW